MNNAKNNYKILIVDSSRLIVDRINVLLGEMQFSEITMAFSYGEALEKLTADKFDVVVLDTQLPGKNGFELLAFIKSNFPNTKTIMLTNQTSDVYRAKGAQMGTDHFIDKSSEFEKVVVIIKEYSTTYQMN